MKNIFTLGILLLVLFSCTKKNRYTQNAPEIDIVKSVINNYDYQKWDSLTMHYADTAKVYYNTRDMYFTAKNLPNYHKKNDSSFLTRAFEENRREFEMIIDDTGKKWVNFWGIWEGNLLENNKKIVMPIHITYQFIDKEIVLEYGYWNSSELILELQHLEDMKKTDTIFIR